MKKSHNVLKYADLNGHRYVHLKVGFKAVHKGFEDCGCQKEVLGVAAFETV